MTTNGTMIACDVCGAKMFKASAYAASDFRTDGWEVIDGIGTVCPECSKAYHNMIDAWVEERGGVPDESNDQN